MLKTKHIAELSTETVYTSTFRTNLSSAFGVKVMEGKNSRYVAYGVSLKTGDAYGEMHEMPSLRVLRCAAGRVVTEAIIASKKAK